MKHTTLQSITARLRHDIITSSTEAASGHPTSSLSAVELMATLFFGGFLHYDLDKPNYILNDRIIFSKGHASPLFYSLYHMAGALSYEELMTFRKIDSNLEGHPTPRFQYTEASTGSLGQGLSVGVGMALGIRLALQQHNLTTVASPHVYVLLGDSEMAEGQVWEAMELASHYKLNNLIGILDCNRLGQRGETMLGWDLKTYEKRAAAFGWNTIVVSDGHDELEVKKAFETAVKNTSDKPTLIIAKTNKGHGVSFLQNADNWHGKPVGKDQLAAALQEIGEVDATLVSPLTKPAVIELKESSISALDIAMPDYAKPAATREAYGDVLVAIGKKDPRLVVLDAEVSNSTFAEKFGKEFPDRFFEMYIAEQNMASVAVGLSRLGYKPFISSFAAFLTRAFDQIRMAQYSDANVNVVGSHAGVSIGYDGSSQMGLEDIAMMRSLLNSVVLYPSDAVSTVRLAVLLAERQGIGYLRLTREKTQTLYSHEDSFVIGGSKVLRSSVADKAIIIAAGITLHEALKAYDELQKIGINVAVIDAYSVKPLDAKTIVKHATKSGHVIVVEDHYPYGGLGDAVATALIGTGVQMKHLAVEATPHSGAPSELMAIEHIDADAIVKAVKQIV